jgi:DNA-binding phage protein
LDGKEGPKLYFTTVLKEVLEDGDPQLIISALDDIKRCVIKNNNQRL